VNLPDDPDLDPARLQCAVHELGHLTVWEALPGVRVNGVWVKGHGLRRVHGCVDVAIPDNSPELDRGYLVGVLAGREADRIFCDLTNARHDPRTCSYDMANFRRTRRRHKPSRRWSETELAREARGIIRANWSTVLRRATQLARRGSL